MVNELHITRTHRQIHSYRKSVSINTVRELFVFLEDNNHIKGQNKFFFLSQLFTDTNGLTEVDKKNPKVTFQNILDRWEALSSGDMSFYNNFGEVVRKYRGSHKDMEKCLMWLSRVSNLVYLRSSQKAVEASKDSEVGIQLKQA